MLAAVFSFRGRINRLQYFGGLVGLFVSVLVAALVAVLSVGDLSALRDQPSRLVPVLLIAVLAVPVWVWISLSIQARRIRDIGLNPLLVIPACLVVETIVHAFGASVPAGAPTASLGAVLSMLVDFAYSLGLLFWPGRPHDDGQPRASWADKVVLPSAPSAPAPSMPMTPSLADGPAAQPAGPVTFGRRGL
jgi:uncharacterized membrane protein YhaH (DUF805 family)